MTLMHPCDEILAGFTVYVSSSAGPGLNVYQDCHCKCEYFFSSMGWLVLESPSEGLSCDAVVELPCLSCPSGGLGMAQW